MTDPVVNEFYATLANGEPCFVRRLEIGDIIEESDLYLSTAGTWQPAPIWGLPIIENGTEWARPL